MPLDTISLAEPATHAHVAPPIWPAPRGYGVTETANRLSIPRAAFVGLCEHHGVLAMAGFDGRQQRRLATVKAAQGALACNVLGGAKRVCGRPVDGAELAFPVFNPARLNDLAWMLDWPGLVARVAAMAGRRERLKFLLTDFGEMTDDVVGGLAGYSRAGVQKTRTALALRDCAP